MPKIMRNSSLLSKKFHSLSRIESISNPYTINSRFCVIIVVVKHIDKNCNQ